MGLELIMLTKFIEHKTTDQTIWVYMYSWYGASFAEIAPKFQIIGILYTSMTT